MTVPNRLCSFCTVPCLIFLHAPAINIHAFHKASFTSNSNKLLLSSPPSTWPELAHKELKADRRRGLMKLRLIIGKLQKGLSLLATRGPHDEFDEELEVAKMVPEDVREGHFAVFAVKGKEAKRFVVKLESLNNPAFLRLLEQAKEEYGFQQKGALEVPCRPEELHKILDCRREKSRISATYMY